MVQTSLHNTKLELVGLAQEVYPKLRWLSTDESVDTQIDGPIIFTISDKMIPFRTLAVVNVEMDVKTVLEWNINDV